MQGDALASAILSLIFPGLGQAINGYYIKGIIMFAIALLFSFAIFYLGLGLIGNIIYYIYAIYAAFNAYVTYKH